MTKIKLAVLKLPALFYPVLEEANYAAVAQLAQLRQFVQSDASVCSDGDYGFIDWGDMPSGTYDWDMVANAASTDWATTGEFSSIAKNHCGATAVTNFAVADFMSCHGTALMSCR